MPNNKESTIAQDLVNKNKNNTNIGAYIRSVRLAQKLSIKDITVRTGLSRLVIEKIEKNQFDEIASPIFIREYITKYARCLNIDTLPILMQIDQQHCNIANDFDENLVASKSKLSNLIEKVLRISLACLLSIFCVIILIESFSSNSWLISKFKVILNPYMDTNYVQNEITINNNKEENTVSSDTNNENNQQTVLLPELKSDKNTYVRTLAPIDNNNKATINFQGRTWIEIHDKNDISIVNTIKQKGEQIELDKKGSPYRLNITRPEFAFFYIKGEFVPIQNLRSKSKYREIILDLNK